MRIQLLLFGITADVIGQKSITLELDENASIGFLKEKILAENPKLGNYKSFSVAINMEYATDESLLKNGDTVALIPPVSGG